MVGVEHVEYRLTGPPARRIGSQPKQRVWIDGLVINNGVPGVERVEEAKAERVGRFNDDVGRIYGLRGVDEGGQRIGLVARSQRRVLL